MDIGEKRRTKAVATKMMHAAVVTEFGKPLEMQEWAIPVPGPGQILVKTEACGVCHSDLHAAKGDWPIKPTLPFIPGHEAIGIVVALGAGVTNIKEGDRVGVPWLYSACGHCEHCLSAWETVCAEAQFGGYTKNGGFAEYILADPDYVAHIPKSLDPKAAAPLICAGLTSYKGIKETKAKPGDWIAISGVGGLGHLAIQYAKAMGLLVCAVDIDDGKLDHAKRLGADLLVDAKNGDPAAAVAKGTDGGAHGVLITDIFELNHRCYGYRRLQASLTRQRVTISEKVVQRLMKQESLIVSKPKRRRYGSYLGEISLAPENLINRDFQAAAPNEKWLTDITEFQIPAGKVYLSPVIDCFDGLVISWSIGTHPDAELVNTMLDAAIETVADGNARPIVHSDRGAHYRWPGWLSRIGDAKLIRSMSRKGCSPDNAACEGFFGRLKAELFYPRDWKATTIEQFIQVVDSYIRWYNEKRIKISLGSLSPIEYRKSLGLMT